MGSQCTYGPHAINLPLVFGPARFQRGAGQGAFEAQNEPASMTLPLMVGTLLRLLPTLEECVRMAC